MFNFESYPNLGVNYIHGNEPDDTLCLADFAVADMNTHRAMLFYFLIFPIRDKS